MKKFLEQINKYFNIAITWYLKLNEKWQPVASAVIMLILLVLLSFPVFAGDPHSGVVIQEGTLTPTSIDYCGAAAVSAASGQHNYKAGNALQWSGAGVLFIEGECDASAASIGLAKQMGKVFGAINFNSDGEENLFGFSFSGTF